MKKVFILTAWILVFPASSLFGQLSEGGKPRMVPTLKNTVGSVITMPFVSNDMLRWEQESEQDGRMLKPLTFAHPFEVQLSPVNDGIWVQTDDRWWIWSLSIRSEGALSINLLFEKFNLPEEGRLFIFTPGQERIIGALTSANNSESGILATMPLPGDQITVQYETPRKPVSEPAFEITRVNHDFLGILKYVDTRRPRGITAGECNVDVNCTIADRWRDVANSVCRVMVLGKDLCTGTLMNNTAQNKKPYILTANHCINTPLKAGGTLFLFNYESPYCGSLDGDVTNSLAGSKLKATLDSLDFALVELNTPPPPSLRPYYAGWNRSSQPTDTTATIHHPQGDIKKIAIDYNAPVQSTFTSYPEFLKNSFWKILRWENGTTEIGSSGGPAFNRSGQLFGTLSGGAAVCSNPVNDYFARFDIAWNYKPDSAKQLKHWLDPSGTNPLSLNGKIFETGENLCRAFTNLHDGDTHRLLKSASSSGGYMSGTNSDGIIEIADKFSIPGDEKILGVSLGIGRKFQTSSSNNSYISIKVYNLQGQTPVLLAERDTVLLKNLAENAMNYIKFNSPVEPGDTFLVSVNLEKIKTKDTLALYQSTRMVTPPDNSFWLKKQSGWISFRDENKFGYSGSLALAVLACNIGSAKVDTLPLDQKDPVIIWPNPTKSKLFIQASEEISGSMISVYNLLGQQIRILSEQKLPRLVEIDLTGNTPGLYVIRVKNGKKYYQTKILLVSH